MFIFGLGPHAIPLWIVLNTTLHCACAEALILGVVEDCEALALARREVGEHNLRGKRVVGLLEGGGRCGDVLVVLVLVLVVLVVLV